MGRLIVAKPLPSDRCRPPAPAGIGSTKGVAEGTRTPDHRDHNPGLYQLSYRHLAAFIVALSLRNGLSNGRARQSRHGLQDGPASGASVSEGGVPGSSS
jgi:hypothetical protein